MKLTEIFFHLRPRGLLRALAGLDRRYRQILRAYLAAGARTLLAEMAEFLFRTRFVAPGSLRTVPGYPEKLDTEARAPASDFRYPLASKNLFSSPSTAGAGAVTSCVSGRERRKARP
ncbi:MAG: hypothetical protein HY717_13015 [Planctomycetes bacterium]|nr:hypothetical protein [Planctomycetota bacterium]